MANVSNQRPARPQNLFEVLFLLWYWGLQWELKMPVL